MKCIFLVPLSTFMGCVVASSRVDAQVAPSSNTLAVQQKAVIVTTMAEALVSEVSLIRDRALLEKNTEKISDFKWSMTYSDRSWVLQARGFEGRDQIDLTVGGFLWDQENGDWMVSYTGLGKLGKEDLRAYGNADWIDGGNEHAFKGINFRHVGEFGAHSIWGWVVGGETIIGGTIVGGATVAAVIATTGPLGVGAAVWIGAGGFVTGSAALIGASAAAKELLKPGQPVPVLPRPERPAPPTNGETLVASKGKIYTAISPDGQIAASGPDGAYKLVGHFNNKEEEA